jgi:hypothetical protein
MPRVPSRLVAYPAAIGLSAFLLFVVQPFVGRVALPAYGGAPAAWATVLVCFQIALLLGYGYAHVSITRLGPRRGGPIHLVLLALAVGLFLLGPTRFTDARIGDLPPAVDLLRLLALTVGMPAIVLAATTPLLSAWLASLRAALDEPAGPGGPAGPTGRDPYRLYAVSNAGSLLAVVAYPFLVEPWLGLGAQRVAFALGLLLLLGLFTVAVVVVRQRGTDVATGPARAARPTAPAPSRLAFARWILLAAVPAGLLAAVTNLVATDLISAPLLWIGPLGIYLASLIVAFSGPGPSVARRLAWLVPIAVVLLVVPYAAPTDWPVVPVLTIEYGGFAVIALVLHGGLAGARPDPGRLTTFYLAVALGGALGGAFVALVAPVAFDGIWEYPILLVGALVAMSVTPDLAAAAAAPVRRKRPPSRILDLAPATAGATRRLVVYLLIAGAIATVLTLARSISVSDASTWLLIGAAMLVFGGEIRAFTVVAIVVLGIAVATPPPVVFRDRSFFGVVEVLRPEGLGLTALRHGTTVHGLQADDPARRREPLGYFSEAGPLGDVMARLDDRRDGQARRIVVTGLGAGTIAAYARPGDTITFIEIDPLIERVAADPTLFTYLSDAAVEPRILIGDGRLELERAPDGSADLVVLDAFSSDSVPIHLLTREALVDARRVLATDGLLAVNISSRSYALGPAVSAGLASTGATVLERLHDPGPEATSQGITTSDWLVAVDDPADVAWFEGRGWHVVPPADQPLTDDRSDVLRLLRPGALW